MKLRDAVQASATAVRLAQDRYDKALVNYLNVLDAQRSFYDLEDQAASSDQELVIQLVALYKALCGGWETYEEPNSGNPPLDEYVVRAKHGQDALEPQFPDIRCIDHIGIVTNVTIYLA